MAAWSPSPCECGSSRNIIIYGDEAFVYCPQCEPMPTDPRGTILCSICEEVPFSHLHHTNYANDETIPVCTGCHGKIHDSTGLLSEYLPEMPRGEAESRGLV